MFNQQQIFLFGQIQTTQTGGQLYSETYPYEVSECSLLWSTVWPSKGQTIVLAFKNLTYFSWEKIDCVKAFTNGSLHKQQLKQEGGATQGNIFRGYTIYGSIHQIFAIKLSFYKFCWTGFREPRPPAEHGGRHRRGGGEQQQQHQIESDLLKLQAKLLQVTSLR